MSEPLTETFARFAEDAKFQLWNEGRTPECRLVYACQGGSVWKFTPEEWWRFVTEAIRNNGEYVLPVSKQFKRHSKRIVDVQNGVSYDKTIHGVKLNRWTLTNWTAELYALELPNAVPPNNL